MEDIKIGDVVELKNQSDCRRLPQLNPRYIIGGSFGCAVTIKYIDLYGDFEIKEDEYCYSPFWIL